MKKILYFFSSLCLVSVVSLLFITEQATSKLARQNKYLLDGSNISFELNDIWKEQYSDEHDLSLSKLNSNLYFTVYKKSEVGVDAEELLKQKIEEELKNCDSKALTEKYNINKTKNRTIYSRLYTVIENDIEKQYYFNVIEFDESDTYVYAVYSAPGAYMKYNIDDIQRLLIKMEWTGEKTILVYNY